MSPDPCTLYPFPLSQFPGPWAHGPMAMVGLHIPSYRVLQIRAKHVAMASAAPTPAPVSMAGEKL